MNLSNEELSLIIKSIPGEFAIYSLQGSTLKTVCSSAGIPGLCGMSAREYDELTAADAADAVLENDREMVAREIDSAVSCGRDMDLTYRLIHKYSDFVWVHSKVRIIGEQDGNRLLLVLIMNTSEETEEHTYLLNHSMGDIYVVDSGTHELLFANDVALQGWNKGKFCGVPCYKYVNGMDEPCPWCTIPNMKDGYAHSEASYSPAQDRWFTIDCRKITWFGRDAVAVYAYDITVQKKREAGLEDTLRLNREEESRNQLIQMQKLQNALRTAEEANRAKSEFVSRISHDIRTPISIISNMTDFALEDISDEEKLKNDLSRIKTADSFLLSLINDVLDISKIDSGKITLNPEPYAYEEHNTNVRNMLEPMCKRKGVKCEFERRHRTGVIVADRVRINQITLNLMSNAVKYTPAGGKVTYISDSEDLPDAKIRFGFELRDTGIGMSKEFQKVMFEPFTQEYDNPLRPKTQSGTGLGLSIVKKIVDMMGGELEVESETGKGTTIRCHIIFPDALRDPAYAGYAERVSKARMKVTSIRGKILMAEDNEMNAEIALRILQQVGLEVVCTANGAEAVDAFSRSAPGEFGAVLMDIQMPVMNGYEATQKIRSLNRSDAGTVPVIALTADAFSDAMKRAHDVGMDGYLTKPLEPDKIYEMLEEKMTDRK